MRASLHLERPSLSHETVCPFLGAFQAAVTCVGVPWYLCVLLGIPWVSVAYAGLSALWVSMWCGMGLQALG